MKIIIIVCSFNLDKDLAGLFYLLEHMLIGASLAKSILAPSTDPAPLPSKVLEGIRQTDGGDVGVPGKVHQTVNLNNCQVVVEVAGVVLRVDVHAKHVKLDVGEELAVVVDIPLPEPDPQLLRPVLLDTVSSCQQVASINQAATTNIHLQIFFLNV